MSSHTIVITGGCGFIGSHLVEHIHRSTDWKIVVIDKLSYASNGMSRLRDAVLLTSPRIRVFTYDLVCPLTEGLFKEIGAVDFIVHLAAETHVDKSVATPVSFVHNNVMSTLHMLEYARLLSNLQLFVYFSTDEVYGCALDGVSYKEEDVHHPSNPYSASKSCGEQICIAYGNTYRVPYLIVNCMNAIGERQHVEKFIPKTIKYILDGKMLDIHSDSTCTVPGSRYYIHARNIANAVLFLLYNGKVGERYNIVGEKEINNLDLAHLIADYMDMQLHYRLVNFHEDRPQHDLHYRLDGTKLHQLGWSPPLDFETSLKKTIEWTIRNPHWLEE